MLVIELEVCSLSSIRFFHGPLDPDRIALVVKVKNLPIAYSIVALLAAVVASLLVIDFLLKTIL